MAEARLSALDASFLAVESANAHMHVGWAALLTPPPDRAMPGFEAIRDHVAGRLRGAPRYRQRLAEIPLGLSDPIWVDDARFDLERHVRRAPPCAFGELVDMALSTPLARDRPLWELWIADRLDNGYLGVVGKAHHCMVDGLGAVELAALLFDPTPEPRAPVPDGWYAAPPPDSFGLVAGAVSDGLSHGLPLARLSLRALREPRRLLDAPEVALRSGRALARAMAPPASPTPLNEPLSPLRHLAFASRPLADLRQLKRCVGATLNDVLLAVAAGGLRRLQTERGETPVKLKTVVPVSLRHGDHTSEAGGNHISFVLVDLPCDEPDPLRRLRTIQSEMSERKRASSALGSHDILRALSYVPAPLRRRLSRLAASRPAFNLTVSNIPGPRAPLYLLGCELDAAYPAVPLPEGRRVSIAMTTIVDAACFGVYSDRDSLADADLLVAGIEASIEELLFHAPGARSA